MTQLRLPDGTLTCVRGLVKRLYPDLLLKAYSQPLSLDPVLHKALQNMHTQYAYEYVHANVTQEELRQIINMSGIPLLYLLKTYSNQIKDRYTFRFGGEPMQVITKSCLSESLISDYSDVLSMSFQQDIRQTIKHGTLPRNKSPHLVLTLPEADHLEAICLANHKSYNRYDELSLIDDPYVQFIWNIGEYLSSNDLLALSNALAQLSGSPIVCERHRSLAIDITKSLTNQRWIAHIPKTYQPLVDVFRYFDSPQSDGWIDYIKMMTPILNGACAGRISLIQNIFYSTASSERTCLLDTPIFCSSLHQSMAELPHTYISDKLNVAFYATRKKRVNTFTYNQDFNHYECA